MTTNATVPTRKTGQLLRFPDFPPRDDMQNWIYIYDDAVATSLKAFLRRNRTPNAIVANEVPVGPNLSARAGIRIPDLMVIFDGELELMLEQRGYEIAQQGKPPDFALEVASPTTGVVDYTAKRTDYERFGVSEYWRFDPSGGEYHDAPLAGDRLVDGRYERIPVEETGDGAIRGYSEALGLYLYWLDGELQFHDPETNTFLRTWDDLETIAETAEAQVQVESARADSEAARANSEAARAERAETRLAELEAELRRLRGE